MLPTYLGRMPIGGLLYMTKMNRIYLARWGLVILGAQHHIYATLPGLNLKL